ncbi:hypothetical protein CSH63_17975 [Micromonospora tulbaghiae]|uniref:Uncharacterized protein n=1 Tax=Micromonospora tulbaghiae TaxID=479978 RepID=A0A386WPI3_9ACTN|nr:hypothetical protein CSH63_17975 [Micromonospora tulbaghiae]
MTGERIRQAVRDWCCVLLGLGIIAHQAFILPPGKASELLIVTGMALVTGPALGGAVQLRREASGDASGSPPSPSPSPSPSSSCPPSSGAGEPS